MSGCGLFNYLSQQFSNGNIDATVNDIKLRASYPGKKIVIVEGKSDYIVLKDLLNTTIQVLLPFCKGNAEKIMAKVGQNYRNIIAILDRDYNALSSDSRILYYDYCNLEMMLIHDDQIFNNFGNGLISSEEALLYRNFVLNCLRPISSLRYFNSLSNVTKCKEFSALKAIGSLSNCLLLPNDAMLYYIKKYMPTNILNSEISFTDASKIVFEFSKLESSLMLMNSYEITNGHDFNELFVKLLPKTCAITTDCSSNSIYFLYNNAFTYNIFKRTKLFMSIKNYEKVSGYLFV